MATDEQHPTPTQMAEISALADGTLDPARRSEVAARVAASPELSERLERERRVVAVLHEARSRDRAPAALRARIEADRRSRGAPVAARIRAGWTAATAGAVAVLAVALALIIPAGSAVAPSIAQAAELGLRAPTQPPPSVEGPLLTQRVGDLAFPSWTQFGLRPVGQRVDRVNGRRIVTVYYAAGGRRVAYTIVAGPELRPPKGPGIGQGGYVFHTFALHGQAVVTWRELGHTCILSGAGVAPARLRAWVASQPV
jgi:anti-sigma factor RsiW